jgi:uncharacterized OB-fold protein
MAPTSSPESEPFWEATRERRLVLQWCTSCGQPVHYPRSFCPHCSSPGSALEWRPASGRGVVHAMTIENRPETTGVESRFVVALVELDEGVRLMTNVVGCEPDECRIGMAVQVTWEELDDGRHLPLFEPGED